MIKVFPNTGTDFSGYCAAEKWLEGQGYRVGSMCSPEPTGFADGNKYGYVGKWWNIGPDGRKLLSGRIERNNDFRNNDVTVIVFDEVDKP